MNFKFAVIVNPILICLAGTPGYYSCTTCVWYECPEYCQEEAKKGVFSKIKEAFHRKPKETASADVANCYNCGDACPTSCYSYSNAYYPQPQYSQSNYFEQSRPPYYYPSGQNQAYQVHQNQGQYANYETPRNAAYSAQCSNNCTSPSCVPCKPVKSPKVAKARDIRCEYTKKTSCTTCKVETKTVHTTKTTRKNCTRKSKHY